ncbi:TPA: hypothetical protein QDZ10_001951 [Stenotrophomonas maltophilia]|nr:hypothetical protein [Stenotrophomonas maltophilia]
MSKQAKQSRTALQTLEDRISTAGGERAEAIATAAAERARADQLPNQVESLAALAVSVERALQTSQKTKMGQTRKRAALPARGDPTKSQDRPTKVRQR